MREPVVIRAGTCRHCGCTEEDPCRLNTGEPCSWADDTRTVCSRPSCMKAEAARKRSAKAARPKRLTAADVHALIRGRKRSCRKVDSRGCIGGRGRVEGE
jgi:hypothetical protein